MTRERDRDEDLKERMDYARIGFEEDLYRLMENQGLTQADLAKTADVSPAFISKVLNGTGNYTLKTMAKLGRALGGTLEVRLTKPNEEVVRVVSHDMARLLDDQRSTSWSPTPEQDLAEVVDLPRQDAPLERTPRKRRRG